MVRRLRQGVFKSSSFCFVGLPNFMQQTVKVNQQKQSRRSAYVVWYLCMTFYFLWVANIHAHAVIWCHMQELGSVPVGDFTGFCGSEMVRSHRELQQLMYVTLMYIKNVYQNDPRSLRSSLQETNVITCHVFGGIFSCILYDLYAFLLSELRLSRVAPISCLPSGSSPWYHARRSDGVSGSPSNWSSGPTPARCGRIFCVRWAAVLSICWSCTNPLHWFSTGESLISIFCTMLVIQEY